MRSSQRAVVVVILVESIGVLLVLGVLVSVVLGDFQRRPAVAKVGSVQTPLIASAITSPLVLTPTPTAMLSPVPLTAPTLVPSTSIAPASFPYIVQPGDTLAAIASTYGVSVDDILAINPQIANPDQIEPGQQILIPSAPTVSATALPLGVTPTLSPGATTPLATVSLTGRPGLEPYTTLISIISGNPDKLAFTYPLVTTAADGKLIVHYQPGAYLDKHQAEVLRMFAEAFAFVEGQMGRPLGASLDLYVAGSLFYDNENLRGFTQSGLYRIFLLVDGSGNLGDQTYLFAHELTHVFAYYQFGKPSSAMLHEGFATYLPQKFLTEQAGFLSLTGICAAIQAAGRLTSVVELEQAKLDPKSQYFAGHIRSFINYNVSACFVNYLVETYGMEKLADVYSSGNYSQVYGMSLADLEADWRTKLAKVTPSVHPYQFVTAVDRMAAAYDDYFSRTTSGEHANWEAYLVLDSARLATNSGALSQAGHGLDVYYSLTSR